jgi:4-hydroxybenzoate polyprenyltransferase
MILARESWPGWGIFVWITVAMFGARTLAMSANRLINAKEDSLNPRTKNRHMPLGLLKPVEVLGMMALALGIFVLAASQLNTLTLILAPITAIYIVLYSFAKYFTWACNFMLGSALAIAPAGAWVGVTGSIEWETVLLAFAVSMWAGGFDIIYACTDYDFDKSNGINSVPAKFGITTALRIVRVMHIISATSLLALGLSMGLGYFYYAGWIIAVVLLIYENKMVKADDLSKVGVAFFRINSYISVQFLVFTILALISKNIWPTL